MGDIKTFPSILVEGSNPGSGLQGMNPGLAGMNSGHTPFSYVFDSPNSLIHLFFSFLKNSDSLGHCWGLGIVLSNEGLAIPVKAMLSQTYPNYPNSDSLVFNQGSEIMRSSEGAPQVPIETSLSQVCPEKLSFTPWERSLYAHHSSLLVNVFLILHTDLSQLNLNDGFSIILAGGSCLGQTSTSSLFPPIGHKKTYINVCQKLYILLLKPKNKIATKTTMRTLRYVTYIHTFLSFFLSLPKVIVYKCLDVRHIVIPYISFMIYSGVF